VWGRVNSSAFSILFTLRDSLKRDCRQRGVRGHREDSGGGCAGFRGASVVERGEDHAHRPGNGRRRRAWSPRLTVAGRLARFMMKKTTGGFGL
ncbi:hypothetical protein LEMLEM_LOCUS24402, partial [Lemmus lemmus]